MEVVQARRIDPFLDEVKSNAGNDYLVLADEVVEKIMAQKSIVESREIDSNNTGKAEKIANIEFKTMFKTARNPFKSFKVREKCEQIV